MEFWAKKAGRYSPASKFRSVIHNRPWLAFVMLWTSMTMPEAQGTHPRLLEYEEQVNQNLDRICQSIQMANIWSAIGSKEAQQDCEKDAHNQLGRSQ